MAQQVSSAYELGASKSCGLVDTSWLSAFVLYPSVGAGISHLAASQIELPAGDVFEYVRSFHTLYKMLDQELIRKRNNSEVGPVAAHIHNMCPEHMRAERVGSFVFAASYAAGNDQPIPLVYTSRKRGENAHESSADTAVNLSKSGVPRSINFATLPITPEEAVCSRIDRAYIVGKVGVPTSFKRPQSTFLFVGAHDNSYGPAGANNLLEIVVDPAHMSDRLDLRHVEPQS